MRELRICPASGSLPVAIYALYLSRRSVVGCSYSHQSLGRPSSCRFARLPPSCTVKSLGHSRRLHLFSAFILLHPLCTRYGIVLQKIRWRKKPIRRWAESFHGNKKIFCVFPATAATRKTVNQMKIKRCSKVRTQPGVASCEHGRSLQYAVRCKHR